MSQPVSKDDNIVVLMGPTGSGKSTFIECATRQDGQTVGHKLRSFTSEIRTVRITHPKNNRKVVFVDTPGFDDTTKTDVEILSMIADWLVQAYHRKVNLATIIYLHKISDNRMTGSLLKNLQMFASICGQDAMPRVVVATTMWGKVDKDEGIQREAELKGDFWKETLDGCTTARFDMTYDCAWSIIGSLDKRERGTLPLLPLEIVDDQMRLNETKAGITLNKELEKLFNDRKDAIRRLDQQAKKQDNELVVQQLNERTKEIDQKIREIAEQLRKLRIPFPRKVLRFFKRGKRY